jgi:hypothetical protein
MALIERPIRQSGKEAELRDLGLSYRGFDSVLPCWRHVHMGEVAPVTGSGRQMLLEYTRSNQLQNDWTGVKLWW